MSEMRRCDSEFPLSARKRQGLGVETSLGTLRLTIRAEAHAADAPLQGRRASIATDEECQEFAELLTQPASSTATTPSPSPTSSESSSSSSATFPERRRRTMLAKETSETLDQLSALYAAFFRSSMDMSKAEFVRCARHISRLHEALPPERTNEIVRDPQRVKIAGFFLAYAQACYGSVLLNLMNHGGGVADLVRVNTDFKNACRYLGLAKEHIFVWSFSSRVFAPNVFMAHDPRINAIVVATRGSWTLHDILTDLMCEYRPFMGGWVHGGVLQTCQEFVKQYLPPLARQVRLKRPAAIYLTGHSLGGAVSSLICLILNSHLAEFRRLAQNPRLQIRCYAFSPPPIASAALCDQMAGLVDSIVNENELVPRLSYSAANDYKQLLVAVRDILARPGLSAHERQRAIAEKRRAILQDASASRARIYIPGTVYFMYKTSRAWDALPLEPDSAANAAPAVSRWRRLATRLRLGAKTLPMQVRKRGPLDGIQAAALTDEERPFHEPVPAWELPHEPHYVLERSRREFFCDLRFRGHMLTDHFPNNIEKAVKCVYSWVAEHQSAVGGLPVRPPAIATAFRATSSSESPVPSGEVLVSGGKLPIAQSELVTSGELRVTGDVDSDASASETATPDGISPAAFPVAAPELSASDNTPISELQQVDFMWAKPAEPASEASSIHSRAGSSNALAKTTTAGLIPKEP